MALTKAHNRMIAGSALNVLDYGAVADGVIDCTSAIQAALDDLPVNGGEIYIPAGSYLLQGSLSWPRQKHVTLIGAGSSGQGNGISHPGATELIYAGSGAAIIMVGTGFDIDQVGGELRGFTLKGPSSGGSSIGIDVQWASGSSGEFSLNDLYIYNFNIGVRLDAVFESAFYNVCVRGCNRGWHVNPTVEAVNANHWYNCRIESCSTGIEIFNSANSNIWHGGTIQGTDIGVYIVGTANAPNLNGFKDVWFESANAGCRGVLVFTNPVNPAPKANYFKNCLFTTHEKGLELASGDGTIVSECLFFNGYTGTKVPVFVSANATNTLLNRNFNFSGNNDYSFTAAGDGLQIIDVVSNAIRTRNNDVGTVEVQTSGRTDYATANEVTMFKNLGTNVIYGDVTVATANPRADWPNAMQHIGYSDNFLTETWRLHNAIKMPSYTTAQRNALFPTYNGDVIYNTTTGKIEAYAGGTWVALH